jgi:diadenosine tetraphosphatase ApaH/serine/threonine PP2A family protein phosphatase
MLHPRPNPYRYQHLSGPFDIVGDVHGCYDELLTLLNALGYEIQRDQNGETRVRHPENRLLIFVGDLVDRGPKVVETLRLARTLVRQRRALVVAGNHELKLFKALQRGDNPAPKHGLEESLRQLATVSALERDAVVAFLQRLEPHYLLDYGRLLVAHAGLKQALHGQTTQEAFNFAIYGETTGEKDEYGLPVRLRWASRYHGSPLVVYGHTPVPSPDWENNSVNIDTGCVFGGHLTALRYPEREIVSVPAGQIYYASAKPFPVSSQSAPVSV